MTDGNIITASNIIVQEAQNQLPIVTIVREHPRTEISLLDDKTPLCCPCFLCIGCVKCCGSTCFDCNRLVCFRYCCPNKFQKKQSSWSCCFDLIISILTNVTSNIIPVKMNIKTMRFLQDQNIPTLFLRSKKVLVRKGDYFIEKSKRKDPYLCPFEWVYSKEDALVYGNRKKSMRLDFSDTANFKDKKFIFYIHGGGFFAGKPGSHRLIVANMVNKLNAIAMVIHYRRSPEYPYPIPLQDSFEAYKWLASMINPINILVAGDSAGGNLAISLIMKLRDEKLPMVKCGILLSPWVDIFDGESESMRSNKGIDFLPPAAVVFVAQQYINPPTDIYSPTFQSLNNLPPILIEVGGGEILRDQILIFAEKLKKSNCFVKVNLYPEMVHVFQLFSMLKMEAPKQSFENMRQFVETISNLPHSEQITTTLPNSEFSEDITKEDIA